MYLGYIDTYGGTNYVPTIVMHLKDLLLLSIRLGTLVFVKGRVFDSDATVSIKAWITTAMLFYLNLYYNCSNCLKSGQ